MARSCQKCRTELQERSKFCHRCGTPFRLRCQNCNTELQDRSKFCRMCGTPLNVPSPKVSAEAWLPATEQIAQPAISMVPPVEEMRDIKPSRPVTAQTELAPMGRFLVSDLGEPNQPLAPATHALVGIFEQAGFALRFGAFMFDLLPLMILLFISGLLANEFLNFGTLIQYSCFSASALYLVLNFIVLAGRKGQTIGKWLLGIRIITINQRRATTKQILLRHLLGYPLSLSAFSLGFLWLLWDRRQQGWHDKLAGTLVVRKRMNW